MRADEKFQCVLVSIGVTVPRWFSKEISILEALPKASQVVLSLKCRWKAYGDTHKTKLS